MSENRKTPLYKVEFEDDARIINLIYNQSRLIHSAEETEKRLVGIANSLASTNIPVLPLVIFEQESSICVLFSDEVEHDVENVKSFFEKNDSLLPKIESDFSAELKLDYSFNEPRCMSGGYEDVDCNLADSFMKKEYNLR